MLSEAAGVLREVLASHPASSDGAGGTNQDPAQRSTSGGAGDQGVSSSESPIAAAAKIQAQLETLESQLHERGPSIRAVKFEATECAEQTALLDSGATHAVLDASSVEKAELIPCTVSLAGDQRQVWHQTPGGSLVAPASKERWHHADHIATRMPD